MLRSVRLSVTVRGLWSLQNTDRNLTVSSSQISSHWNWTRNDGSTAAQFSSLPMRWHEVNDGNGLNVGAVVVSNNSHPRHCACAISQSLVPRCLFISSVRVRVRFRFNNFHLSYCELFGNASYLAWHRLMTLLSFCCGMWQSHFSIKRAAAVLGIGTDNVVIVRTDQRCILIFPHHLFLTPFDWILFSFDGALVKKKQFNRSSDRKDKVRCRVSQNIRLIRAALLLGNRRNRQTDRQTNGYQTDALRLRL